MSEQSPEVELCGATAQLYLSDKDNVLTARVDTTGLPAGALIRVSLNDTDLYLGDPERD